LPPVKYPTDRRAVGRLADSVSPLAEASPPADGGHSLRLSFWDLKRELSPGGFVDNPMACWRHLVRRNPIDATGFCGHRTSS